jgi:cell division protein ZapA
MSQVNVTIDGKSYRMACDPGQEEHLKDLATRFDRYVGHLKGSFGEIGDLRLTVMAGIMVMDELTELQKRVAGLEAEMESLRRTRDEALQKADSADSQLLDRLGAVAGKIEAVTAKLA